jgi:hypothetical protein
MTTVLALIVVCIVDVIVIVLRHYKIHWTRSSTIFLMNFKLSIAAISEHKTEED